MMAVGLKLNLVRFWSSGLVEMSMFSWDFEVDSLLRFWRWNSSKLCVRTHDMTSRSYFCKMNSTLGSVVTLAMFQSTRRNFMPFYVNLCFYTVLLQSSKCCEIFCLKNSDHRIFWQISSLVCSVGEFKVSDWCWTSVTQVVAELNTISPEEAGPPLSA